MPQFRKKPIVIEAVKVLDLIRAKEADTPSEVPAWVIEAYGEGTLDIYAIDAEVHTLEGVMTAELDDWIIKGVKGEFYPCKPDIFLTTYEPA